MHILSFVISIIAFVVCWIPFWSIPVSLAAVIISLIVMNKLFISNKKDEIQKGKGLAFTGFVFAILAMIGSIMMVGIPLGIFLLSY